MADNWPAAAHEVYVLCDCGDVEHCRMERYVSDVRIAEQRVRQLEQAEQAVEWIARVWGADPRTLMHA